MDLFSYRELAAAIALLVTITFAYLFSEWISGDPLRGLVVVAIVLMFLMMVIMGVAFQFNQRMIRTHRQRRRMYGPMPAYINPPGAMGPPPGFPPPQVAPPPAVQQQPPPPVQSYQPNVVYPVYAPRQPGPPPGPPERRHPMPRQETGNCPSCGGKLFVGRANCPHCSARIG
jgi:hypothetical protein